MGSAVSSPIGPEGAQFSDALYVVHFRVKIYFYFMYFIIRYKNTNLYLLQNGNSTSIALFIFCPKNFLCSLRV